MTGGVCSLILTQVLNKWSVMVHRKLKPDQEDAELDGEEGEKKGKKVIFHQMHYLVIC